MIKRSILLILAHLLPHSLWAQYTPDILGEEFEQQSFEMGEDYSGRVVATLVRATPQPQTTKALLYIHGFNDYFFQSEMAERFQSEGYRFYALDLRKYGRSKLPENKLFELRDISEYYADIDIALRTIRREGSNDITLMGHSTGGLIVTLYAHNNPDAVDRLILNSPFLDMNSSWFQERALIPLVSSIAALAPQMKIPMGSSTAYGESLHRDHHGEWVFDTTLKTSPSPSMNSSWLRAIHLAHKQVQSVRDLNIPILLMYSDKSTRQDEWSPAMQSADGVLSVDDIKHYGSLLGKRVRHAEIKNGMHDLILSSPIVRDRAYEEIFEWLREPNSER